MQYTNAAPKTRRYSDVVLLPWYDLQCRCGGCFDLWMCAFAREAHEEHYYDTKFDNGDDSEACCSYDRTAGKIPPVIDQLVGCILCGTKERNINASLRSSWQFGSFSNFPRGLDCLFCYIIFSFLLVSSISWEAPQGSTCCLYFAGNKRPLWSPVLNYKNI